MLKIEKIEKLQKQEIPSHPYFNKVEGKRINYDLLREKKKPIERVKIRKKTIDDTEIENLRRQKEYQNDLKFDLNLDILNNDRKTVFNSARNGNLEF